MIDSKAKLISITRDYMTGHFVLTIELLDKGSISIDELKDKVLSLVLKVFREKRSLDANSYFHALVGKLADVLHISKNRCKNELICKYGQQEFIDNEMVIIKTNIQPIHMWEQEFLHCLPCRTEIEKGKEVVFYKVFRGSHTYNTKEMSVLIDGTVEECKEQGIDVCTDQERQKMLERWAEIYAKRMDSSKSSITY